MKLRVTVFLSTLCLIPLLLLGRGRECYAPKSTYETQLKEGIDAFYKTEWNQASAIFEELMQRDAADPRAFFFDSMIPFWEYFYGGNSSEAANEFLKRADKAIKVSRRRFEKNPKDTTMVLMLSGLYGYQSLVAASEHHYQTALNSGSTGFKYTRQLLALDDKDPRALIGKGIFNYMIGGVPTGLRWMTNMMGLKGDKQEGFQLLEEAARSDSYISNDARMILAYLYKREGEFQKALVAISKLCKRYPQNIIFQYNYATLLEKFDRQADARRAYERIVRRKGTYLTELRRQSAVRLRQLGSS